MILTRNRGAFCLAVACFNAGACDLYESRTCAQSLQMHLVLSWSSLPKVKWGFPSDGFKELYMYMAKIPWHPVRPLRQACLMCMPAVSEALILQ